MPLTALKRVRLAYIAASYLTLVFVMVRAATMQQEAATDALFGTALAVFVTMACVTDSAVLGRPIAFEVRLPFAITWPAALPIYLLLSRGWWGVAVLLTILGLLIGTAIACAAIGVIATMIAR
jgi:hypothetical protein